MEYVNDKIFLLICNCFNHIVMTTVDNDESLDSIWNPNLRQTQTQPTISWLPLTSEQVCNIFFLINFVYMFLLK